jgi:ligand-binding sensor domain-containing protein
MLGATLVARPKNFLFTDSYLSSNLVNNIFQDSDGFLWISTENGLNRFDGAKVTCYFHEKDNPHSLAHNFVCFVHEDREGNLLVGSYLGVQLYHRDTDDFTEVACFEDGSALTAAPSYLVETRDGRIYTSGNVICQIVVREGVPQLKKMNWNDKGMVSRLHEDAQGFLWCRNGVGDFYRISPDGRMELIQLATQYGAVDVFSDGQYNIYISTRSHDLWHYDADRQTWSKINNTPVSRAAIRCVFSLDDKTLLVGTDGNGVKSIDKKSGRVEDYEVDLPALTSDLLKVHQIFRDCEGNLWLALFMKGVAHLFKQKSPEILGSMLLAEHNLYFLVRLAENIRKSIEEDRFLEFKKEFLEKYGCKD